MSFSIIALSSIVPWNSVLKWKDSLRLQPGNEISKTAVCSFHLSHKLPAYDPGIYIFKSGVSISSVSVLSVS